MATCMDCEQEMNDPGVRSCTHARLRFGDGPVVDRVRYSTSPEEGDGWARDADHRCHDCNVAPGGIHHFGCDVERCPRCDGQLICCDCEYEGELVPARAG
jgi:hypothetical protein